MRYTSVIIKVLFILLFGIVSSLAFSKPLPQGVKVGDRVYAQLAVDSNGYPVYLEAVLLGVSEDRSICKVTFIIPENYNGAGKRVVRIGPCDNVVKVAEDNRKSHK